MSINPNKFLALPPSKSSSLVVSKKTSIIKPDKIFDSSKEKIKEPNKFKIDSRLLRIEKKVINIDNLLKDFLSIQKNKFKKQSSEKEINQRKKRENELEKNVKKPSGVKLPGMPKPKLGLFDWIKNFISNVILGFIAVRLIDHLPKLAKLIPIINGVMNFIIDWGGKLLNGLVTFIDWGYNAIDASRMFVSNVFGESGAKAFDNFATNFRDVIKYSLIAAMLIADVGDDIMGGSGRGRGGGRGGGYRNSYGGGRRGLDGDFRRGRFGGYVRGFGVDAEVGGGVQGFNLWKQQAGSGELTDAGLKKAQNNLMKRYFQKYGRDAFINRFGEEGLKRLPGGMQRGLLQRGARSAFTGVLGKGGAKTVLKFVKPFTNKLPIIGAFLDFALSIALGEPIGRAAFKAIGAGVLGTIGTVAGSVIPFAGNLIGGIAGSALGDWAGGALYDLFFENKNNNAKTTQPEQKVEKYAEGGATRGGKYISSTPQRTIKKKKITRSISPPTSSLEPGRSVGGNAKSKTDPSKKIIETYYPNNTSENEVKPYQYLYSSHKNISKISYLGSLFGLVTKTILGDKPSPMDYWNVSEGLNSWINTILGKLNLGYADGGLVNGDIENQDLRNWLAVTIQNTVSPRINQVINDLMKQLLLKPMTGPGGPSPSPPGGTNQTDDPNAQFQGQADFVIGDDIAHGFAGRSGNGTDTSDSKKGRKPSEILAILKAKGEELKGKLIDLSTGIAHSKDDWPIVNDQLKYLQSIGVKVRLLGVGKQWDEKVGGNQVNTKLQQLSSQYGAYFYGGHNASGDRTLGLQGSTQDYEEVKHKLASTQVSGGVASPGDGKFIQGNSGDSGGIHFHIGPGTQPGQVNTKYNADARMSASKLVKHFLGKKTMTDGRRRNAAYTSGSDAEMMLAQKAHSAFGAGSQGGIDIQVGGAYDPGAKIAFPFAVSNMAYRPGGFGVSAKIDGFNAFVAHGRYDEKGRIAKQERGTNMYAFHGGYIRNTRENQPFTFIKTHDGEFIIDKDSVDAFRFPFIDLINRIESKSHLKSVIGKLMNMLDYEDERPQTIIVDVYEDEPENPTYIVNRQNIFVSSSQEEDNSYFDSVSV